MSFGSRFGRLVREKRGVEGLTQQQLAVSAFGDENKKSQISRVENGHIDNPQASTIDALVVKLNISQTELNDCHDKKEQHPVAENQHHQRTDEDRRLKLRTARSVLNFSLNEAFRHAKDMAISANQLSKASISNQFNGPGVPRKIIDDLSECFGYAEECASEALLRLLRHLQICDARRDNEGAPINVAVNRMFDAVRLYAMARRLFPYTVFQTEEPSLYLFQNDINDALAMIAPQGMNSVLREKVVDRFEVHFRTSSVI